MVTVDRARSLARRVLESLLSADEAGRLAFVVVHAETGRSPSGELPVDASMQIVYGIGDDRGATWLTSDETPEQLGALLTDELQTFIAESGFGWGDWREPREGRAGEA
jgi:predicted DCC family thiol-disulfide oxidoreductase YuxK